MFFNTQEAGPEFDPYGGAWLWAGAGKDIIRNHTFIQVLMFIV